jgi:hypothetical protein
VVPDLQGINITPRHFPGIDGSTIACGIAVIFFEGSLTWDELLSTASSTGLVTL